MNEFDIPVDVDGDGTADYIVVGVDQGAVQTGTFNGVMGAFVFSTRSGGAASKFLAHRPARQLDDPVPCSSSQLCRAGEPCLNAANPRFDVLGGRLRPDRHGRPDPVDGIAKFNAWKARSARAASQTVAPGGTATKPIQINSAEWALTPALGVMVVTLDNKSRQEEAETLKVKRRLDQVVGREHDVRTREARRGRGYAGPVAFRGLECCGAKPT